MAEDKMNTGPEEQVPGEGETTVTPPETAGGGPPVQEDQDRIFHTSQIKGFAGREKGNGFSFPLPQTGGGTMAM